YKCTGGCEEDKKKKNKNKCKAPSKSEVCADVGCGTVTDKCGNKVDCPNTCSKQKVCGASAGVSSESGSKVANKCIHELTKKIIEIIENYGDELSKETLDKLKDAKRLILNDQVEFTELEGSGGSYDGDKNEIKIDKSNSIDKQLMSLIHERQHAVQDLHGEKIEPSGYNTKQDYFDAMSRLETEAISEEMKAYEELIDKGAIDEIKEEERWLSVYQDGRDELQDRVEKFYSIKWGNAWAVRDRK
ncbi:MAG: DUF6782 family putative metallopeptidase, partial [Flavobacteriales bacterium]